MVRTITVSSKGYMNAVPDSVRITITLVNKNNNYSDTIYESEKVKRIICNALNSCGFDDDSIKTISYDVNGEYEGFEAEDKSWKQRLIGFRCNHILAITFPLDNKKINEVLSSISIDEISPEISIGFTINDIKSFREAAIKMAIDEAKTNAKLIADSTGVNLGEIVSVIYGKSNADFVNQTSNIQLLNSRGKCMDMSFNPDDIKIEESVTIEWEIK